MIKIFIAKISSIVITLYYSFYSLYLTFKGKPDHTFYKLLRNWSKIVLKMNYVELIITGKPIPKDEKTVVYAANHSSLHDIPIIFAAVHSNLRIIYKRELEKIPLFGYALRKSPLIAITRSNPRDSMASMQMAIETIRKNASVVIFPEGTRNPAREEIGPFKRGAFLMASRSGKKIVPLAITGSSDVLQWKPRGEKTYKVWVDFLEPVEIRDSANRAEETKIMAQVRNAIMNQVKKRSQLLK